MRALGLALGLILGTSAAALATSSGRGDTPERISVTYRCAGGLRLPVIFINPPQSDAGYAALVLDGQLMVLPLVPSASGARYRLEDAPTAYQLWIKGDEAMIHRETNGTEQPLALDCRIAR